MPCFRCPSGLRPANLPTARHFNAPPASSKAAHRLCGIGGCGCGVGGPQRRHGARPLDLPAQVARPDAPPVPSITSSSTRTSLGGAAGESIVTPAAGPQATAAAVPDTTAGAATRRRRRAARGTDGSETPAAALSNPPGAQPGAALTIETHTTHRSDVAERCTPPPGGSEGKGDAQQQHAGSRPHPKRRSCPVQMGPTPCGAGGGRSDAASASADKSSTGVAGTAHSGSRTRSKRAGVSIAIPSTTHKSSNNNGSSSQHTAAGEHAGSSSLDTSVRPNSSGSSSTKSRNARGETACSNGSVIKGSGGSNTGGGSRSSSTGGVGSSSDGSGSSTGGGGSSSDGGGRKSSSKSESRNRQPTLQPLKQPVVDGSRPEPAADTAAGPWAPILAFLTQGQRRCSSGAAVQPCDGSTALQPHSEVAAAAAAATVATLTSPPALAAAAAARSLATDWPFIEAFRTGNAPAQAVVEASAAASAAAAAATASVPATNSQPLGPAVPGAHGAERRRRWASLRTVAADGVHAKAGSAAGAAVLWPLMPEQLRIMASSRILSSVMEGGRGAAASRDSSGGSGGGGGDRGGGDGDDDPAVIAATTAVLERVARSVLDHGVYPVRYGATKLRTTIREAMLAARPAALRTLLVTSPRSPALTSSPSPSSPPSVAASSSASAEAFAALERMEGLLWVPEQVRAACLERLRVEAKYMSGAEVAAVLAALGAAALPLDPKANVPLIERALKLLAAGLPNADHQQSQSQQQQQQQQQLQLANTQTEVGPRSTARGKLRRPTPPAAREQRRLPPPLAALLMLLLVTVLPKELSARRVRWTMWSQLQEILLLMPRRRQQQQLFQQQWSRQAAGAGPEWALEEDGDVAIMERMRSRLYAAEGEKAAVEAAWGADVWTDAAEAESATTSAAASRGELPLLAVAALLVVADRLQVLMHASKVEEAAQQRLARSAHLLTARQLTTLLRCYTEKQAMVGSDVLSRWVARLTDAVEAGGVAPGAVPGLLQLLAGQVYLLERRELHRLTAGIFKAMAQQAAQEEEQQEEAQPAAAAPAGAPAMAAAAGTAAAAADNDQQQQRRRRRLAAICGELEAALGRLRLEWADPDRLSSVRRELAAFTASGGAHPKAVLRAWRALLRNPVCRPAPPAHHLRHRCRAASSPAADPDDDIDSRYEPEADPADAFIDQARNELLAWAAGRNGSEGGSSVLEQFV